MAPIMDVTGYCPACGKSKLHLLAAGALRCLNADCPDPEAAHKLLSDPETEHIADFREDGVTVQHPLRERLEPGAGTSLFQCRVFQLCTALPGPPGGMVGKYRVREHMGGVAAELLEAGSAN